MTLPKSLYDEVKSYIERNTFEIVTPEFHYYAYHMPNTTYQVSNDIDEILIRLSPKAYRVWHRTLSIAKRNEDPVLSCVVKCSFSLYSDVSSRNSFFAALEELCGAQLLIKTSSKGIYVINIRYASKLFKPKH